MEAGDQFTAWEVCGLEVLIATDQAPHIFFLLLLGGEGGGPGKCLARLWVCRRGCDGPPFLCCIIFVLL